MYPGHPRAHPEASAPPFRSTASTKPINSKFDIWASGEHCSSEFPLLILLVSSCLLMCPRQSHAFKLGRPTNLNWYLEFRRHADSALMCVLPSACHVKDQHPSPALVLLKQHLHQPPAECEKTQHCLIAWACVLAAACHVNGQYPAPAAASIDITRQSGTINTQRSVRMAWKQHENVNTEGMYSYTCVHIFC